MSLASVALRAIALDITHDLLDHVVQTDHDAGAKASAVGAQWWPAMTRHAGGQALAQGAVLAAVEVASGRRSWGRVLAGTAVIGASHAFLDRRWPVKRLLEATGSAAFAAPRVRLPEREVLTETPAQADERFWDEDSRRAAMGHRPGFLRGTVQESSTDLPLHGMYLADQSLHRGVTLGVALALC